MRHGVKKKRLGRDAAHRKAMLRNLATSVLIKGMDEDPMERRITTTVQKAKAVRPLVDRLVTYGKKGDLSARRQAARHVTQPQAVQGLFDTIAPRYADRAGGYTRVLKLEERRVGDCAEMAIISLVEDEIRKRPKKKRTKKAQKDKKLDITQANEPDKKEESSATETGVESENQDEEKGEKGSESSESAKAETASEAGEKKAEPDQEKAKPEEEKNPENNSADEGDDKKS